MSDRNIPITTILSDNFGVGTVTPTSFKVQVSGSVGPDSASIFNLGSSVLPWANIYGNVSGSLYGTASQAVSSSWAASSSVAISASWAPGTITAVATSASWASASISSSYSLTSSYSPQVKSLVLCAGYTPTATGADVAQLIVPYDTNGTSSLSWTVSRLNFRVESSGSSASEIKIEKSSGTGIFNAVLIGSVTMSANTYESVTTGSLGSVLSGDKIRFNVITLGNAQNWTVGPEISR